MTHQIKSCVCVERRGHSRGGKRANKSSVVEIWPRKDIRSSCKTRVSSPACSFKWNGQLKTQQSPPVGRREHKHTQEKIGRTFSSENPTGCKPESIIAQSQPHALHSRPSYTLKRIGFGWGVCDSGNGLELTHCSQELWGWFGVGPFRDRVAVTIYRCRSRAMYSQGNGTGALEFRQEVWPRKKNEEIESHMFISRS